MSRTPIFINELHYENLFSDAYEGAEIAGFFFFFFLSSKFQYLFTFIAGPASTDLSGWKIVLYGGKDGKVYNNFDLDGVIPNLQNGYGCLFFYLKG